MAVIHIKTCTCTIYEAIPFLCLQMYLHARYSHTVTRCVVPNYARVHHFLSKGFNAYHKHSTLYHTHMSGKHSSPGKHTKSFGTYRRQSTVFRIYAKHLKKLSPSETRTLHWCTSELIICVSMKRTVDSGPTRDIIMGRFVGQIIVIYHIRSYVDFAGVEPIGKSNVWLVFT